MARKLSFSVETILSNEISPSTSLHRNDSAGRMLEIASVCGDRRPDYGCAAARQILHEGLEGGRGGVHHQRSLSSSIVPMDMQRLPTPPTSPLSTASAPSPITDTSLDEESVIEVQSEGGDDMSSTTSPIQDGNSCSKKGRMRFSQDQISVLEQRFQEQQYLLPADRKILSVTLRMTERQIKTWFQNKRAQYKRARHMSSGQGSPSAGGLHHAGYIMSPVHVPRSLYHHHHTAAGPLGVPPLPTTPLSNQATPHHYNQIMFRFPTISSLAPPIAPSGVSIQSAGLAPSSPSLFSHSTEQKHFVLAPPHSPVVMGTPTRINAPLPLLARPFPI